MGNSDSHASFVDGVRHLLDEDVPYDDAQFWSALFSSPMSVEDVFEIVGPEHVRHLRSKRPHNLQVLLLRLARRMDEVQTSAIGAGCIPASEVTPASTCVRLLTRIAPFLMENCEDSENVETILWRPGGLVSDGTRPTTADAAEEVIGKELLRQVMGFLFMPGYTIHTRAKVDASKLAGLPKPPTHRVDTSVLWKGGVGVSSELLVPSSQVFWKTRAEVLRCLLACISGPLFQTSEEYQERPPTWLRHFCGGEVAHTANLFCSLMSTVFSYDPVGWGVPYGGFFASGSEEDLVDVSSQVLCIIMDFDPPSLKAGEEDSSKERILNVYRYMLKHIEKDREIDLIFRGLVRMLSTVYQANQTYLPNSKRAIGFYQEALVLLWQLATINPTFLQRVVEHMPTNQIVLPVLYLIQQAHSSLSQVGLLHTASFVLLVLSAERSFAVKLNEPYEGKGGFLVLPSFKGSYADALTLCLYKVVSDCLCIPQSDALVEMLLTVLCNISPYVKCFCAECCLKLLSLVDRCGRASYLFRSAHTHHSLVFLLELLANVIQYQYEGNNMLIYSTLRQKAVFERIKNISVPANSVRDVADASTANGDETGATGVEAHGDSDGSETAGKWSPTEEWLEAVKVKLPLQAITCTSDYLEAHVEACKRDDVIDQDEVLKFLKGTTMVGILPVPHPIVTRTYQASSYTAMWFTSYMWGVIFTRSQRMPLYDWRQIRLVVINH